MHHHRPPPSGQKGITCISNVSFIMILCWFPLLSTNIIETDTILTFIWRSKVFGAIAPSLVAFQFFYRTDLIMHCLALLVTQFSKYHSISKNEHFETRFVPDKHPLHVFFLVLHNLNLIFVTLFFRFQILRRLESLHQKNMYWMKISRKINFQSWIFRNSF